MQLFAVSFVPLPGYSTCFGRFTHPSSGLQFHLYLQPPVQIIASYQLGEAWEFWNKETLFFFLRKYGRVELEVFYVYGSVHHNPFF